MLNKTLKFWYFKTFLFSEMYVIIKLSLEICLHLYGTHRQVALGLTSCSFNSTGLICWSY